MPFAVRTHFDVNPSPAAAKATMEGAQYNNMGRQLSEAGDLSGAEQMHLRAIKVKERSLGTEHIKTALSYNAIGELYTKMGRLDDAKEFLQKSVRIRDASRNPVDELDAAGSRENLAIVYEMQGNLHRAKELRRVGFPDKMLCAHYYCPHLTQHRKNLMQCRGCKSIYYCGKSCQTADWRRHKKYCKKEQADV
ncbi:uncharacterized protein LAESUDRAFT_684918 [Laetiporus sulphureus 93-53]|uniref:MYND-type domain-containing protein n=1 Tax=Laetiporus sulphureus 93-53 TaxID=1314785 RepID=A0A165CF03_9APHY|nr:uncharacterized protein LAESUDRAFT_684918 [Laetiporus sulphureus 93-53]KZT02694.1 hypothetical protein LAESUDRAFT_684918 [Laetiporus sulphureus 93-53]